MGPDIGVIVVWIGLSGQKEPMELKEMSFGDGVIAGFISGTRPGAWRVG
jgi:hypothetical protein